MRLVGWVSGVAGVRAREGVVLLLSGCSRMEGVIQDYVG